MQSRICRSRSGFSAYFNDVCDFFLRGHHLPTALSVPAIIDWKPTGSYFNLPAFLIVLALSWILVRGIRESADTNGLLVAVKLVAILIFVGGAAHAIKPQNWHPFLPNGYSGLLTGGAIIFFTYIGFDSISCAAEETRNPQRDMPIGIFGTLLVCAILYASVALVLTGIVNWKTLTGDAPVADALKTLSMNKLGAIVNVGALLGMISSLSGLPIRPSQSLVCHVTRPLVARRVFKSSQEAPNSLREHLGGGLRRRYSVRLVHGCFFCQSGEHRDFVCVRAGIAGRDRSSVQGARSPARVSRSGVAVYAV